MKMSLKMASDKTAMRMKNEVKRIRTFVVSGYYARHSRRERLQAAEGGRKKSAPAE